MKKDPKAPSVTIYRTTLVSARFEGWGPFTWETEHKEIVLKTVVDFREYPWDGDSFGIASSYCEGVTKCPDWVNQVSG